MSLDANELKTQQQLNKMDSPLDYLSIYYDVYCNTIYIVYRLVSQL